MALLEQSGQASHDGGEAGGSTGSGGSSAADARFRALFERAAVGIGLVSFESTRWIEVNDALCRLVGYTREQMLATAWPQMTHPDDVELDLRPFRQMAAGELDTYSVDKRFIHRDGQLVWARLNLSVVRDADGRPDYEIAVVEDISDRKRVEAEVEEREERLRAALLEQERGRAVLDAVLDALPTAVLIADTQGSLLRWNRAAAYMWGLHSTESEQTRSIGDYGGWRGWWYPSGEPLRAEDWAMSRVLRTKELVAGDLVQIAPFDGSPRRVMVIMGAPVHGPNDELLGGVVVQADITDRIRVEEALRASEQRYALAARATRNAIWDWNLLTGTLDWNPEVHTLFGYPPGAIPRDVQWWIDSIHPEDRVRVVDGIHAVVDAAGADPDGDQSWSAEYRFRRGDGEYALVTDRGYVVCDAEDRPLRMIGAMTDVTRERAAEAERERLLVAERAARLELSEREAEFRAMADNIPQLAWMADASGQIYWYNRRWYDYTGATLEQMRGEGWRSVPRPDYLERVETSLRRAWETGEPWEETFPMRGRDGQYRWFLSRAMPIRDAQGRVVRWFGTNTDITAQREAEQALADADRRKDEFLAMLAHELRNPMAPISNALTILERSEEPSLLAAARSMMKRQLRQLVRLVDDLLEVSRITTGKLKLAPERLELQRVLQQAIETAGPRIDASGHRLVVEPATREVWLQGDRARLAQVFTNLLDNAAKYTPAGGTIALRVDLGEPGRVRVSVTDTGVGIAEESLGRVFELFTQLDHAVDKAHDGLGIGLSLAQRLVELHGGRIAVSSPGQGQGATFTVDLPVIEAPPARGTERTRGPAAAASCCVLVADDNRDAADTLAMMLSISGHRVTVAYGGRDAIAAVHAALQIDPVQLAIVDIGMPDCDGYEVARSLRSALGGTCPVLVALTGWGQETDKKRASEAGFDRHYTKPVDPAHIEQLISRICAVAPQQA